jgi:hypothetical protein
MPLLLPCGQSVSFGAMRRQWQLRYHTSASGAMYASRWLASSSTFTSSFVTPDSDMLPRVPLAPDGSSVCEEATVYHAVARPRVAPLPVALARLSTEASQWRGMGRSAHHVGKTNTQCAGAAGGAARRTKEGDSVLIGRKRVGVRTEAGQDVRPMARNIALMSDACQTHVRREKFIGAVLISLVAQTLFRPLRRQSFTLERQLHSQYTVPRYPSLPWSFGLSQCQGLILEFDTDRRLSDILTAIYSIYMAPLCTYFSCLYPSIPTNTPLVFHLSGTSHCSVAVVLVQAVLHSFPGFCFPTNNTNILSSFRCQDNSVTDRSSLSAMVRWPRTFPHVAGAENFLGTKLPCHHLYLSRWGRRLWGSRHRSYRSRYRRSYRWRYRWCWGCGRQC